VNINKKERTELPGHDSGIMRAMDKCVWEEQLEEDSWDKTAGKGKQGQDSRDRTAGKV
jgi:hypothetical protein